MYGRFHRGCRAVSSHFLASALNSSTDDARKCGCQYLQEVTLRKPGDRVTIARKHGLEGLDIPEFRILLHHCRNALQAVDDLRVHGVLDPQRAVLIEGGDALLGPHELRARPVRGGVDEIEDRLFGGRVVPGWKRVLLRQGRVRADRKSGHGKRRERRQYRAPAGDVNFAHRVSLVDAKRPRRLLRDRHGGCAYCPSWALIISSTWAFTASRLNEAGACIGGYSMAVCAKAPTRCCTTNETPELAGVEVVHVAAAESRSGSRRGSTASARRDPGGY